MVLGCFLKKELPWNGGFACQAFALHPNYFKSSKACAMYKQVMPPQLCGGIGRQ